MSYCNIDDVQAVVETDMEPHSIQDLIDETDAIMALELDVASLGATVLKAISRTCTAYKVMLKDPASKSIEGESESRIENIRQLKDLCAKYTNAASGGIAFTMTSSSIEG